MALPFTQIVPVYSGDITYPIYDPLYTDVPFDLYSNLAASNSFLPIYNFQFQTAFSNGATVWKNNTLHNVSAVVGAGYVIPQPATFVSMNYNANLPGVVTVGNASLSNENLYTFYENGMIYAVSPCQRAIGNPSYFCSFPVANGQNTSLGLSVFPSKAYGSISSQIIGLSFSLLLDNKIYVGWSGSMTGAGIHQRQLNAVYVLDPEIDFVNFQIAPDADWNGYTASARSCYYTNNDNWLLCQLTTPQDAFSLHHITSGFGCTNYSIAFSDLPFLDDNIFITLCPLGFLCRSNLGTDPVQLLILSYDGTKYWNVILDDQSSYGFTGDFYSQYKIDQNNILWATGSPTGTGSTPIGYSFVPVTVTLDPEKFQPVSLSIPTLPCYDTCDYNTGLFQDT